MITHFIDKAGNRLIRYKDRKWGVKNNKGKLVTNQELLKFIRRNKLMEKMRDYKSY